MVVLDLLRLVAALCAGVAAAWWRQAPEVVAAERDLFRIGRRYEQVRLVIHRLGAGVAAVVGVALLVSIWR